MSARDGHTTDASGMDDHELERYELDESPRYDFAVSRRDFLQTVGAGVVVLLAVTPAGALLAQDPRRRQRGGFGSMPEEIGAWLHVAEDGTVAVYTGKAEVGQNIRTSLAQAVAEELRVPVARISMVMADTDRVPYDMGTFGSMTTPRMASQLRRAAVAARGILVDTAAEEWQVEASSLRVAGGQVTHAGSGRSAGIGELTKGRKLTKTIRGASDPTPAAAWKIAGQPVPKVDGKAMVTGEHRYAADVVRPGMLHGKILRSPAFEAELVSAETSAAEALEGVTVVREGNFIGVAASSELRARRALAEIRAEWKTPAQPSHEEVFDHLRANRREGGGRRRGGPIRKGSLDAGLEAADVALERTYTIAYIAHAPLEPRAAVAEWTDDKLTVWTGSQRPFGVKGQLVEAFGVPESQVRVIVPDTGSGYGGKHTGEAALEAARLAKAAGMPVKVAWTREEEFTWAYFRPAGVIDVKSGVTRAGKLMAWKFANINSGGSGIRTPYEVENQEIDSYASDSPLRQGSYRALAATANHFARELHMDELAREVAMDPLEFRLRNLEDGRLRAVFQAAAERFGWQASSGRGNGIAGGYDKGGYVASCVEVVEVDGQIEVKRIVTAFECGAVVNPTHLENQIEGAVIMGLGGALWETIEFADGKVVNPRFSRYRVPRFGDVPELETVIVDRKDLPSAGAGETPIVAVAPAIANAILAATGRCLRSLPMRPNGAA